MPLIIKLNINKNCCKREHLLSLMNTICLFLGTLISLCSGVVNLVLILLFVTLKKDIIMWLLLVSIIISSLNSICYPILLMFNMYNESPPN
jgi:O-antigen/teichoic acid export membrane protein